MVETPIRRFLLGSAVVLLFPKGSLGFNPAGAPGRPIRLGEAMAYQHILVSTECGTATVTLNRPDKRNALSLPLMRKLTEALQDVGRSTARGVILAANGTVFSAGHNFGDMAGASLAQARELFAV